MDLLEGDLHFYEQDIKCTSKKQCFGNELLTRIGKNKDSIETILNDISLKDKVKLDLMILKKFYNLYLNSEDRKLLPSNINIHIETILNDEFIIILKKFKNIGVFLNIEILEYSNKLDEEDYFYLKVNKKIDLLHSLGFKIGIDDYPERNSKNFLRNLNNIDFVKIDKQFLLKKDDNFLGLISKNVTEIKTYHKNALIIIEGVEEGKYIDALLEVGVDAFQGYYFGKPKEIKK